MKRFRIAFMSVLASALGLFMAAELKGETIEWTGGNGNWSEPSNWSGSEVPGESDAVVIGKQVTVNLAGAVKIASLTLSNKATLHVTAQPLSDSDRSVFNPASYATEQARRDAVAAALWANRTIVEVTGDFIVDAGCTVQPENDKITGTPVVFKVGSASIAGTINATGLGWGWELLSDDSAERPDNVPAGALAQRGGGSGIVNKWLYTYAFGSGSKDRGDFGFCPLYGGTTDADKTSVYGYPCAPFLPGSPSLFYSDILTMRGGGSIIIHAATSVSVSGSLEAIGKRNGQNAGCSGGGVWLAAPDITLADAAKICADGEPGVNNNQGKGGGGRIALTRVFSESELDTLASGTVLPSMAVSDCVNPNVTATSPNASYNGTVKQAVSGAQATLTTQSNVPGLKATGVTWGNEVLLNGEYERTAPQYARLADDSTIRYTCQGYVVSNKNGQVSSSDVDLTVTFTIDGSLGPYSLTWKWGDRTVVDPDPVSRRWVGGSSGSLDDPNNWDPAGVPTYMDELYVTNATIAASKVKVAKLVFSGGSLTIGSSTSQEPIEFSVGDMALCGGATLHVTARPLNDVTVFDPAKYANEEARRAAIAAALWAGRTIVEVTGEFVVDAGCTVQPENDKITGTPVVFKVGSATIAGTINATGMGWGWGLLSEDSAMRPDNVPAGALAQHNSGGRLWLYTYAFGSGSGEVGAYGFSPLYGGTMALDQTYVYGYPCAPFLPGSPSQFQNYARDMRGGGSIVIHAATNVSVTGTLVTIGKRDGGSGTQAAGCAGGGIWLAAPDIDLSDAAVISANGEDFSSGVYGKGGGGRIALTSVASEDELATLVLGEIPPKMVVSDYVNPNVTATSSKPENNGTVKQALSGNLSATLTTQSNVPGLLAAGVTWGDEVLMNGDYARTAPQYAYLAEDQTVRYTCQGYVVSDKNGEASSSDVERTARFTIESSCGPYTLTWKWGDRTVVDPDPVSRHWVGPAAGGVFSDYRNWDPAGAPTRVDELYVTNAAIAVSRVEVGKLVLSSVNLSVANAEEFIVNGDMELSGNSVWTIKALPTNGTATAYADGATRVAIGGNLVLTDTATVKPVSDPWTGGSVGFSVAGDFTLGETAKFDAVSAGWAWVEYTDTPSPLALATVTTEGKTYQTMAIGHGSSYGVGGSYGGIGGGNQNTYGFANAPFYPGSPAGWYSSWNMYPGGGLIRIHAGGKAIVNGTLDASGDSNTYGGTSGGGIWLTAAKFAFGETALLLAHGGQANYSSQGGGGRIAIGTGLTAGQMASLLATGKCARKALGLDAFRAVYPGVTVNVERGVNTGSWATGGEDGTFSYYPPPKGLLLLMR